MTHTIRDLQVVDLRFPTSREAHGSDAMHTDPDYSAAYVMLRTEGPSGGRTDGRCDGQTGHGLTFTLGRGTEVCVAAVEAIAPLVVGRTLEEITADFGAFWHSLASESQLRWLGPEKGVIHLSLAAVINAIWDLWARVEAKPLWKLLADLSPEQIVRCIDFRHITDFLTEDDALAILEAHAATKGERERELRVTGYPAYTTSAGWLGYPDDEVRRRCRAAVEDGFTHFKVKVGRDFEENVHRGQLVRDAIGPDRTLMFDANQVWDVSEAIEAMKHLAPLRPLWIEEPTSPDDILGHAAIAEAVHPIGVATGEHCQNRVMFKQFLQAQAMDFCQIDACRLGGVNEVLAVLLMAAKARVPVCPHAGGVGLCEYVQHLAMFDYLAVSGTMEGRVIEYVDHLHEHFVDPVVIRAARYQTPTTPGYSIEIKSETLRDHRFPDGIVWR